MKLRSLPKQLHAWEGKRVLLRVDWNVPLDRELDDESLLRLSRSLPTVKRLIEAGAKVILVTHCGRPTSARDREYSTERLVPLLKRQHMHVAWHNANLLDADDRSRLLDAINAAKPGTLHLLENIRFYSGEEKNQSMFSKQLASLAEVFINDAFAVSHRAHASVVGVTRYLDSYAGLALEEEVSELITYRKKTSKKRAPTIAFFGGKKISSKKEAILQLMKTADTVYLGGAMVLVAEAARGRALGKSYVEAGQQAFAKKLIAAKNVVLPCDYVVADALAPAASVRISDGADLKKHEYIVDVGPRTLVLWAEAIRGASRALWNGPMGITEIEAFGAGSRGLARFLGCLSKTVQTVAGGGDTIPVLAQAGVMNRISFVSTGGGAMLEFLVLGEALPGLKPLILSA